MHLCLLRDGITPLRTHNTATPTFVSLTHLLSFTPFACIPLQRGPGCLIIDWVHNHCLLAVCQTEHWQKARPQIESKSLCRSSSTPSTGPQCRTFTYTERLSNRHWQIANTEHLQQLLLSASSSNTHRRVSSYTHFLIYAHTYTRAYAFRCVCCPGWYTIILQTDSTWQLPSNPVLVLQNRNRPLMAANAHSVFLNASP